MATPSDLVTLAQAQAWIAAAASDTTVLPGLITQISRAILTNLQRPYLLPRAYTETRDGGGDTEIVLRNWPVLAVSSLAIAGVVIPPSPSLVAGQAWQAGYVLEPSDGLPPGRMQALSLRGHRFWGGASSVVIGYSAGYQVSGEAATVPGASPYQVTAQAPYGVWGSDAGVTYANGTALTAVNGAPSTGQYSVAAGVYTFAAADAGAAMLVSYGYVPADLANAALEWIADRYAYKDRVGARTKSLGGAETMSWNITSIPTFVDMALQPYRRVIMP